ncbi:MAG: mechanosensitive ion channel [Nannocystaceae bacterium]
MTPVATPTLPSIVHAGAQPVAQPGAPTGGLTAELTAEILALRMGVGLWSLVGVIALIFVGWVLSIVIHWLIRVAQRLGAPRAPWVDNLGALARLLIWAWIVTSIVAGGWRLAPLLTLLAAGVIATGLLIGLLRHFENLSTGIGLALRGRIKVGDQISVGEHSGMVRSVGLMHIHLRVADGSTVYLPNRLLADTPVAIGRARNSYPLRVRLAGHGVWPPAAIETARWIAALSPYRDVNARVSVQVEGADQSVLVVEIQVWSPRLLDAAEKHLRAMLAEHVGDAAAAEGAAPERPARPRPRFNAEESDEAWGRRPSVLDDPPS